MKRLITLFILALLLFFQGGARADILEVETDSGIKHALWINFNIGYGIVERDQSPKGAIAYGLNFNIYLNKGLVTQLSFLETQSLESLESEPRESIKSIGLLFGKALETRNFVWAFQAGPSYLSGFHSWPGVCDPEFIGPCYYDFDYFKSLGIHLDCQMLYKPQHNELGLEFYANLNKETPFAGVLLCFNFISRY